MSSIRQVKTRFYVVWWNPAIGRHVTESLSKFAGVPVTTKRMAEKYHQKWIRQHKVPTGRMKDGVVPFFADLREHNKARKTAYTNEVDNRRLASFERWASKHGLNRLRAIRRRHIEEYRDSLTCGPTTKNHYVATLSAAFNVAIDWEIMEANPAARIKRLPNYSPRHVRALTDKEVTIIGESFPSPEREFCLIALWSGMRRSDIVYLMWDDIGSDTIVIRPKPEYGYAPKSTRYRGRLDRIPILPPLREVLNGIPEAGPFVFARGDGPLYRPLTWSKYISPLMATHGINGVSIHSLRHTFVTRLARAGVNPMALRILARHATLATTAGYTHLDDTDLLREARKITA